MTASGPPVLHDLLRAADPRARDEAWAAFVDAHSRLLLKVASARHRGYDDTMDRYAFILEGLREQECRRLRAYQPREARFTTWLVVVARRLCTDFERERYGRTRDPGAAEAVTRRALADLAGAVPVNEELVPAPDDVAAAADDDEQRRLLDAAVATLPAEDRLLVRLRYYDGVSVREIREAVGLPTVFHVYRRLNAIHARIRDGLGRAGITGTSS